MYKMMPSSPEDHCEPTRVYSGIGRYRRACPLAALPASAEGKRVALVIGNSAYSNVPIAHQSERMMPAISPQL